MVSQFTFDFSACIKKHFDSIAQEQNKSTEALMAEVLYDWLLNFNKGRATSAEALAFLQIEPNPSPVQASELVVKQHDVSHRLRVGGKFVKDPNKPTNQTKKKSGRGNPGRQGRIKTSSAKQPLRSQAPSKHRPESRGSGTKTSDTCKNS